jgi:aspartyl-tRNA(Asn)/glutamyl-tRNA(Gln) amidotransferase subunit A
MSATKLPTIAALAAKLQAGLVTSERLTQDCLDRIADPSGEGVRTFLHTNPQQALTCARASDAQRRVGIVASPLAGVPISVKDLFDVQGEITKAGSIMLNDAPKASSDAPAIARLRAAGAIIIGRTNMTEFAYGGHGINAHYDTPRCPWDRATQRIPGGSTSGGAVSLTDGMAHGTIGSDTGGSTRIPAALCGTVGFKPTQRAVPLEGVFPLSFSRDSVGPLGRSVACCALQHQIMAGLPVLDVVNMLPTPLKGLNIGVPSNIVSDELDAEVAAAFDASLNLLSRAGANIVRFHFQALERERAGSTRANFSAVEAYALHRERLQNTPELFDEMVRVRLMVGATMLAADYVDLLTLRQSLIAQAKVETARFAAIALPTVPIIAPTFAQMRTSEAEFFRVNALLLRNCAPFNVFNRPAISLPCHAEGAAPVGLMLVGETDGDAALFAIAQSVEMALQALR